jgi:hypothetical protein
MLPLLNNGNTGLQARNKINAGLAGILPWQVLTKNNSHDTNVLEVTELHRTIVDGCAYNERLRLFLPSFTDALAAGKSVMIRSSRVGQEYKFGIYPHWNDIVGYYGRRFQIGANLACFSLYALEAGASCILTPRTVNQIQLHHGAVSGGSFAVGDTITGQGSGATAKLLYIDADAGVLQLDTYVEGGDGAFAQGETISNGTATADLIRPQINCAEMWQADFVTGAFADLDKSPEWPDGWYQWWY